MMIPAALAMGLLHFNLHGIHHRNPAIPWSRLPAVFQKQSGQFDGSYFEAAVRQLSGPVPLSELAAFREKVA